MPDQPNRAPQAPRPSTAGMPAVQPDARSQAGGLSGLRPAAGLRLRVASLSDVGQARSHQEDAVGAFAPPDPATLARKGHLFIVADGMGGHLAGEVASQMAVAEVSRAYYADPGDDLAGSLERALQAANQAIFLQGQAGAGEQGMGTTAALAVVRGREVQVANVGDSRVYLLRGAAVSQITRDHSWVEEQMRVGILTPEQARQHPQRNLITRALGKKSTLEPDFFSGDLRAGDVLVLCSDGLTSYVSDGEILELAGQGPPEQAVKRLVALANQRGGSDNISVIVVQAELDAPAGPGPAPQAAARRARRPAVALSRPSNRLIALVLAIVAGAVVLALLLWLASSRPDRQDKTSAPAETGPAASTAAPALAPAASATLLPTVTLAPTGNLAPTAFLSSGQQTLLPASATEAPVSQSAPSIAAPSLKRPSEGYKARENEKVVFAWDWQGELAQNQAFEVRIWKQGGDDHLGADKPRAEKGPKTNRWRQEIDIGQSPSIRQGGAGSYLWTVAVVQLDPYERIGPEAPPRELSYSGTAIDESLPRVIPPQPILPRLPGSGS